VILENQRALQRPGQGIVRPNGAAITHSEYPKHMVHPGFQPGIAAKEISIPDPITGKPWRKAYVGDAAIRFPPVLVRDEDQEEYHASQGYVSIGKSDPAAFARAVAAASPTAETHEPAQYPKWIAALNRSVDSAEQEAEALGLPMPEQPAGSEEPGAPSLSTEVKTLLERPDIARLDALEQKVDTIVSSFDKLSGMLAQVIAGQAPAAAPAPPVAAAKARGRRRGPVAAKGKPQRSAQSIARGEKIKAGIAKHRAEAAAQADAATVVTEAAQPLE
jgi:hypothetical protein